MISYIVIAASLLLNAVLLYFLIGYIRRLFSYDDLFQRLADDVETNIEHFTAMRKMSLLANDDVIKNAHRNMMVMHMRLDEFLTRMQEETGLVLRKRTKPMVPVNLTEEADKIVEKING